MAVDIIEKLNILIGDKGAGAIMKKIANNEKNLSALLKRLGEIQAEKRAEEEARAAEEAARLKEEADRKAAEEAERAAKAAKEAALNEEKKRADEEKAKAAEKPTEKPAEAPKPKAAEKPAAAPAPAERVQPSRPVYRPDAQRNAAPRSPAAGGQRNTYIPSKPAFGQRPQGQGARPPFNSQRPQGQGGFQRPPRPAGGLRTPAAPPPPPPAQRRDAPKKYDKTYVEHRPVNKRALQRQQGADVNDFDEDKSGYRKARFGKKGAKKESQTIKIEHAVVTSKEIPIKELSEKLGISAVEITKRLFKEGVMKTVNESIDYDNAAYIALELGIDLEYKPEKTAEETLFEEHGADEAENTVTRAPVVTVMGHVDHGKTSLLDKIRSTNVTAGEAGGITQSIGAYTVTLSEGKKITFIDTPGHEAFTAMRARGAKITDIVVLVVAADDGIMPQTVEAINHAKAAEVPIIVAMNKMDKPQAEPDKVKQGLLNHGLVPEEWGGDVIVVPVSAKTGEGIDSLLENIYLQAEMSELKANPDRRARGVVIEAKLDKGKGPMASVLVQNGTLHTGDNLISGMTMGRVRAMFDDTGKMVKEAGPSMAVSVLGLDDVPNAGDGIYAVDQSLMKKVQEERKTHLRESMVKETQKLSVDDFFKQAESDAKKNFNLIVKADVQGSVEALKASLLKLSNEEVEIKILHAAAGAVNESDVMLAESAKAMIIGFNVRPDSKAKTLAERSHVEVRQYRIIYELLDDIEAALGGMLSPKYQEVYMGKAEVKQTFDITGVGTVAGCYVTEGKLVRGGKLRIYRDNVMIVEGGVKQLKRFKDDAKEVTSGMECGCAIDGFNEIRIGDFIECYLIEEVKRS